LTFLLAWVAFPLALAALGLGWGALVEELSGTRLPSGALLLPVGLAAAIVVAGLFTTNSVTARFAVPVVAIVAIVGLARTRRVCSGWPRPGWPALAALGVLLAYGAPVLATGTATFTGFVKLDDTSTWFAITTQMFAHGRSTAGLGVSTYKLVLDTNLGAGAYPIGAFMLLGLGSGIVGVDVAWAFAPYLACAGAALSLSLYALCEPIVPSRPLRALVAFVAAQSALLYGYSLWGGIKEMTAAFLIPLVVALTAGAIRSRPAQPRRLLPLAVASAALIVTYGPGTVVWIVPALGSVVVVWLVALARGRWRRPAFARSVGGLAVGTAVLALPVWIVLAESLRADSGFVTGPSSRSSVVRLGNLHAPLGVFHLAGIWPVGDFREPLATSVGSVGLIGLVLGAGLFALWLALRRRRRAPGVALYVGVALFGAAAVYLAGGVPWVVGKSLAVASPALLFAGLVGGAAVFGYGWRGRAAGSVALAVIAGGVLWSNARQYNDATIAPVGPLRELAHINTMIAGQGPTFINDYEVYADRYFLRAGDPIEPAEFRPTTLPLRVAVALTKSAAADLDSFGLQTLLPYESIVTPNSPAESRPASLYYLRWQGRYYDLWQRAVFPTAHILAHIPFGDSNQTPYCGAATGPTGKALAPQPICSTQPVAPAPCEQVRLIARYATSHHAELIADERPPSLFVQADKSEFPVRWLVNPTTHALAAVAPGRAVFTISVAQAGRYDLSLGGSFGRGFDVAVDGRDVGGVHDDLTMIDGYAPIATLSLSAGRHTVAVTYPGPSLAPGSGDMQLTTLSSLALEPLAAATGGRLVTLSPSAATSLCAQSVDWIEVVVPQ
jgi:hypothetical protein